MSVMDKLVFSKSLPFPFGDERHIACLTLTEDRYDNRTSYEAYIGSSSPPNVDDYDYRLREALGVMFHIAQPSPKIIITSKTKIMIFYDIHRHHWNG